VKKRTLYSILAAIVISGLTACEPLDLTGLEKDLGCMVGSLDNHFPNERDPGC
jgi:hypothetical protein